MSRPRFSTLFAGAVAALAALLGVAAVLLDDASTRSAGAATVVTVRLWDEQVAGAYRQSFAAFHRTRPDIEVRVNVVSYASYFDTLRTDVAGGGADDIFWLSNAYLAGYADNGRLLKIDADKADWDPSVVTQFTRDGTLWGCRSSPTPVSRCTTTPNCSPRPESIPPGWCGCGGTRTAPTIRCGPC